MTEKKHVKPVETDHVSSYQHISNGGISFTLFTEKRALAHEFGFLSITHSSFGITHRSIVPVFATSAPILRAIADEIERLQLQDPEYLSHGLDAQISSGFLGDRYYRNKGGVVSEIDADEFYGSSEGGSNMQAG